MIWRPLGRICSDDHSKKARIVAPVIFRLSLLIGLWPTAIGITYAQSSKPLVSLALSQQDDERILHTVQALALQGDWLSMPLILSMEPGPLALKRGSRVLANEVAPRLTPPHLLLISTSGEFDPSYGFLAFIRRVLQEQGHVWVIGGEMPKVLQDLPLPQGDWIRLVRPEDLPAALAGHFDVFRADVAHRWLNL